MLVCLGADAAETQTLHRRLPVTALQLAPVGRLPATQRLKLAISLPLRNQQALTEFLRQVSDPASPNYRHYLTPAQFAARFGPSEADYHAVIAFAQAHGLIVTATHPNRVILDVEGAVPDIEKTLHVTMRLYRHPQEARQFYAPDADPSLDLTVPILDISGLNNYSLPKPRVRVKIAPSAAAGSATPNGAGSAPNGAYMGNDFRTAYVPGTALSGSGQAVGLLQYDGYAASDITYYENLTGRPNVTLTNVLLDGFDGTPSGTNGQVEVSLDIEMVISMAPGISNIIVYEAGAYGNWHDLLNRMATDDLAKQLSCSWYSPGEGGDSVSDQIFQQMAAQGQSFFCASGDSDAFTGLIPFPGDNPYITEVGGSTLSTSGSGGPWSSETVWNWNDGTGSGGGISTQYAIPVWQQGTSMAENQGSTTMRNVPDVALTADNVYVREAGSDQNVGGTSCASPLWAGFTALVNQQAAANQTAAVGFINPALAVIASGSSYNADFHDITTGNNFNSSSPSHFSATAGYDLCTGWGTPVGTPLINALAGPADPLQTSFPSLFSTGMAGGPFTPASEAYTLVNSGTVPVPWSVSATQSWLTLSASGGTISASGSATLTVSLNTNANGLAVGSYSDTITFTDAATGFTQARPVSVTVMPPSPVLSVTPASAYSASGMTGGPFTPSSASYTVANTGNLSMNWTVSNTSSWLSVSPTGGSLASGSSTTVVASITAAANSLAAGAYADTMTFTDVTNGTGNTTRTASLTVTQSHPVITSGTSLVGAKGQVLSYQITATNNPTSYGAGTLPSALRLNTSTGLISGTANVIGTTTVAINARNAGGRGTASLTITVTPDAPVITSGSSATGTAGSAFSYQIAATNSPTSFGAGGLPAGLGVNTMTGLISGTPTLTGTAGATISASNAGGTGSAALAVTILPPPPVVTSSSSATGTQGQAFSYQIAATNNPTSFGASGLPATLSVDPAAGLISGTPSVTGTFNAGISATNSGGTGMSPLTVIITSSSVPALPRWGLAALALLLFLAAAPFLRAKRRRLQ